MFQPNVRDKLTGLEAQLSCQLPEHDPGHQSLSPVLSVQDRAESGAGVSSKDTVNIQKDCGEDNICIPDLKIIFTR